MMIETIGTDYTARQSAAAVSSEKTVEQASEVKQDFAASTEIKLAYNTDRVDISEQGREVAAVQTAAAGATAVQSAEEYEMTATKQAVAQLGDSEEESEVEEYAGDSSNTVLTTLSEQQLDNLVKEGTITRTQADSEIARRKTAQSEGQE